ncbi:MAG: hypothetical protein CVV61_04030 [Tenericutes bacterium HGW-Tenericutes-6]|nr:MAG: hypothetical protein CVV61_04030 [Tenericutes bacterium HGW-Tenericutes-6]
MKYLIACDLDGSLLNKEGHITEKSKNVLKKLESEGHMIVLATGRPFSGAYPKYEFLDLNTPIITDNGGSIEHPKDKTFAKQKTFIPLDMMHEIFKFSKPFTITSFFSIDDMTYAYQYDPKLEAFFSGINSDKVIEGEHTAFTVEPTGLVYIIETNAMQTFEHYISETFGHTLSTRCWGNDPKTAVYEVYLKHISKASAIKYLLEYYNMPHHAWIAFGDGVNDIEMIGQAHHGVAMKNAVDEVKKVADAVTEYDHDDDGLANYLIQFFNLSI